MKACIVFTIEHDKKNDPRLKSFLGKFDVCIMS